MKTIEKTRFDTRLSRTQKEYFEYAATLGGFRNLTEFIVFCAQEQANKIVESHNAILASEKDKAIFFDAIMNPQEPNTKLKKAASRYNEVTANK